MSTPLEVLLRPFSIRREEVGSATLLTAYFFLAMSSVTIIKTVQLSSFLDDVGVNWKLPVVYLISALLCVPIVLLFRALARKYSHLRVLSGSLLFFILTLVAVYAGRPATPRLWFSFSFFLWSSVFSVLLPTLGSVISYDLYTSREGRRVFSLLGMGGILGAASGGFWTYLFSERLGDAGLIIQTLLLLLVLQVILALIHRTNPKSFRVQAAKAQGTDRRPRFDLRSVWPDSRYIRAIAGLVLVSAAASTLIELQYNSFLEKTFSGSELRIFIAGLLAITSLISGVVQLCVTPSLLRRFGVQAGLVVLPITLLLGAGVFLILAGFWAAVALRTIDSSLKSSVQRTALEILYVPQAGPEAVSFKSFVALVVNRTGDAAGAVLFLGALYMVSAARVTSLVVITLTVSALFLAFRLGKGYLENLRRSLEGEGLERRDQLGLSVNPEATIARLHSSDRLRLRLAMEQLARQPAELANDERSAPIGEDMLETHLSGLVYRRQPSWLSKVVDLTHHPDAHAAAAAFHLLVQQDPVKYRRELRHALASDSVPDMVYLAYVETYFDQPETVVRPPQMLGWCQHLPADAQAILARIMGRTRDRGYLPVLRQWVTTDDIQLKRRAIEALGCFAEPRFWDLLVGFLADAKTRQAARKALAHYGDYAVEKMLALLRDPNADLRIKQEIPVVLARINSSSARSALLVALYWPDAVVSFRALKLLNKTRANQELSYSEASFLPVLMQWARQYYQTTSLLALAQGKDSPAWKLLRKVATERCSWGVEKIFRTLELFLPRGDAYLSYLAIKGDRKRLRDNAIELIELRLKGEVKQALLPMFAVDEPRAEEQIDLVRKLFGLSSDLPDVFHDALFFGDSLVRCSIMAVVREEKLIDLRKDVEHFSDDVHPMVSETARWALHSLGVEPQLQA